MTKRLPTFVNRSTPIAKSKVVTESKLGSKAKVGAKVAEEIVAKTDGPPKRLNAKELMLDESILRRLD